MTMRTGWRASRWAIPLLVLFLALPAIRAATLVHVSGTILEVDLDEETLTLRDPSRGDVVIEVPEDAVIVLDGEEDAILDDLFEGDVVEDAEVRVLDSGTLVLVRATVTSTTDDELDEDDEEDGSGD